MKVIFIRGLPGTGKTAVAEILKKRLSNAETINVDEFKIKAMQNGETFENAKETAYKQSLRKLYEIYLMKKNYVIFDELICEEKFLKELYTFLNQTNSLSYWFRLMRKLKDILKVEKGRNRKIKNKLEDFSKLKKDVESLRIPGEYWIKNDELNLTIKKIIEYLK